MLKNKCWKLIKPSRLRRTYVYELYTHKHDTAHDMKFINVLTDVSANEHTSLDMLATDGWHIIIIVHVIQSKNN